MKTCKNVRKAKKKRTAKGKRTAKAAITEGARDSAYLCQANFYKTVI